jgi:acetoin utilization deacetylase AcuC-like enzyme
MPRPVLVYHPDYARHILSPGHVESPERLEAIVQKLESLRLLEGYTVPDPAPREQVEAVHAKEYVDLVESFGEGYLDTDTAVHPDTYGYACLAAGGALAAAFGSAESGRPAFALVRPPGHHAGPAYGGGFCFFNNVAIAAKALLQRLPRVAILDFDAHHGNGTADVFAATRDVLYVSTHQWGIFPGTGPAESVGEGRGEGFTVNIPFPARAGDASFDLAFHEIIEPIVRQFLPEAILVSYGGDAHYKDPLTSLALTSPGYIRLAERTIDLARSAAHGRVAFVLEGGYHLPALAEVMAGTYALFRGESIHLQFTEQRENRERGREAVARAKAVHAKHWDL